MYFEKQIVLDFGCNKNFQCNENAFTENWPKYAPKVRAHVDQDIATEWDQNIENLLLLLHVFPSKGSQFQNSINSLIIFRVVSLFLHFTLD